MTVEENRTQLHVDIEHVKNEIDNIQKLISKLDITIDKMSDIATDISKLLAVQEVRMTAVEKSTTDNSIRLSRSIEKSSVDFREVYEKLQIIESRIDEKIENRRHSNAIVIKELEKKVLQNEKFLWVFSGAAVVIGFLVSKLSNILPRLFM